MELDPMVRAAIENQDEPLPSDLLWHLTEDDLLAGIRDFESGAIDHAFVESTTYDVLHRKRRYPPKAIVGLAARHRFGRVLTPAQVRGGKGTTAFLVLIDRGFTVIPKRDQIYPDEVAQGGTYSEGAHKSVLVNSFERNPKARADCIDHYGDACQVCGMRFAERYPGVQDGYIHVHHLVPLSDIDGEYEVDPIRDLRPVCPNCHAMLHQREDRPYSIDELKAIINLP